MTPYRILVADKIRMDELEPLHDPAHFELVEVNGLKDDALADALADADAILVRSSTKITRASLARTSRLKIVGRAGVGVDTIDVDAATERGVAVLNAPAGNTVSAAELAFALLLSLVRRVAAADRSMRAGGWERSKFTGTELYGKTLGLVGVGRVGGDVARRARAFGMTVVAYDPFLPEQAARRLEVKLHELDDVLRSADVLSLHVPLTDRTAGMIGPVQLDLMKRGAVLVNAARGGVVDEVALLERLRDGRLGGAALDVFEQEPLPADHPFRSLENVVLTPHLGASTEEAQRNVALEIATAVRGALLEGDLSHALNAPAIGGEKMRRLRPLLVLAEQLGKVGAGLVNGPVVDVEVRYAGDVDDALRPLAAAALCGVLSGVVGRPGVNMVNALLLAQQRGITLKRVRLDPVGDYAQFVELRVACRQRKSRVAGALLAAAHPRMVRIDGYHVDIVPRGTLVVLHNRDVPGVIGRVGSVLGDAGVNIGEYHQARLEAGGDALATISIDGRLPSEVADRLRALPEVTDVREIVLGPGH